MSVATAPSSLELLGELEREMGVVVRRVRRVIGERARAVDPELQAGGYLVLSFLTDAGPLRGSALVEGLGIDKGAISRQVQHLVDLGLVVRSPDPADGRAQLLSATAEARARLERVAGERRTQLGERLADFSADELGSFVAALGRYNTALADR